MKLECVMLVFQMDEVERDFEDPEEDLETEDHSEETVEVDADSERTAPVPFKEHEVINEVVKVKCRYCGQTYEQTEDKCPHCGGHA